MSRALFFLLVTATGAAGGWASWSQAGAFQLDHSSFYACSLTPMAITLLALVAGFTPFDRPQSATLWTAPLVGLAVGVAAMGLLVFPVSFVWLSPLLLAYAAGLWSLARQVARAAAGELPAEEEEEDDADGGEDDALQPSWLDLDPATAGYDLAKLRERLRDPPSYRVLTAICALVGGLLVISWSPPPGKARPLSLRAELAPVVSMPGEALPTGRVLRREGWVEVNGPDLQVRLRVDRPQVLVQLRDFQVAVEPCLFLGEATVDGFFAVPELNEYRLEPGGPAVTHYAEGRRPGGRYAWVTADYRRGRLALSALPRLLSPLARVDPDVIHATIGLDVDLERGVVTVDAVTRLDRPLTLHLGSLSWIKVSGLHDPRLLLGLAGPLELNPPQADAPAEFVIQDGDVGRALRARDGSRGPYKVLQQGELEHWLAVVDGAERLLIAAPDWAAQASLATSRGTGYGVPENALVVEREGDAVKLTYDLASTRIGVGRLSVELPAGTYRNRLVLRALLPQEVVRTEGRRAVERLGSLREPD